jgi:hypothetical protein
LLVVPHQYRLSEKHNSLCGPAVILVGNVLTTLWVDASDDQGFVDAVSDIDFHVDDGAYPNGSPWRQIETFKASQNIDGKRVIE